MSAKKVFGNLKGMRQVMADRHGRIAEVVAVDRTFDTFVTTAVGSRRYAVTVEAAWRPQLDAFRPVQCHC